MQVEGILLIMLMAAHYRSPQGHAFPFNPRRLLPNPADSENWLLVHFAVYNLLFALRKVLKLANLALIASNCLSLSMQVLPVTGTLNSTRRDWSRLDRLISHHKFSYWERGLSLHVWVLLVTAYKSCCTVQDLFIHDMASSCYAPMNYDSQKYFLNSHIHASKNLVMMCKHECLTSGRDELESDSVFGACA